MKKSFVYLIIALMLATMLCGCGMDGDDGVIGASPRPTESISTSPSMLPDVSPTVIPNVEDDVESSPSVKSPQVGETDNAKASPNVTDNNSQ